MKSKRTLTSGLASLSALVLLVVAASVPSVGAVSNSLRDRVDDSIAVQSDDGEGTGDNLTADNKKLQVRIEESREKAKAAVEKARENKKTQSEEKRQLVCEKRQKAINNKIAAFTKAADTQLAQLEKVSTKLTDFQAANNVQVEGFTDLTAAADAKKLAAMDAVNALKAVATDVDCADPEVAVTLTTVKNAAQTTRLALREYRASLHDMLVALAKAVETDGDTSNGDTSTEATTEQPTDTVTDGGTEQ